MPEIERTLVDLYMKLYSETETWRPSFEFPNSPKVNDEESEWLQDLYQRQRSSKLLICVRWTRQLAGMASQ